MRRKLTCTNRLQVLLGRTLYIVYPMCFYGYAVHDVKAINLRKEVGRVMSRRLAKVSAWRTCDGWFILGRDKRYMWRLNIPASVGSVLVEQTWDGYLTWQGEVILAERISQAELQLEDLFL